MEVFSEPDTFSTCWHHCELEDLGEVVTTELANLTTGRYYHACGSYTIGEYQSQVGSPHLPTLTQMLIVTGGWNRGRLGSVESLGYTSYHENGGRGEWREISQLPTPLWGLRGGSVGKVFHIVGGWVDDLDTDEILSWDPVQLTWSVAGHMVTALDFDVAHAVTEIPIGAVSNLCDENIRE